MSKYIVGFIVFFISASAFAHEDEDEIEIMAHKAGEAAERFARSFRSRVAGGPRLGLQVDDHKDGVQVDDVVDDSPAQKAGIKEGDLITAIDGHKVQGDSGPRLFTKLIREAKPEATVAIDLQRDGKKLQFKVKLEEPKRVGMIKGFDHHPWDFDFHMGAGGTFGNLELAAVNADLGHYFGVSQGVLVLSTPALNPLKLKGGDVILKIGDRSPRGPVQAIRILRSYEPGDKVTIEVMRQRQTMSVNVEVPESK